MLACINIVQAKQSCSHVHDVGDRSAFDSHCFGSTIMASHELHVLLYTSSDMTYSDTGVY